jgi:NADPH:quinone reductase-like Zn-dependent oxidoreductase
VRRNEANLMKAAFIEQFGGPEVLEYGDVPDPVAGPGEVVVDVAAASVNGADWKVRSAEYSQAKFPLVLGRDFSGLVAATSAGVDDLKVGDAVFGVLEAGREGAYAEKLAIKAAIIAKKPAGLSHIDAAALALTGLTAIISVETTLQLKRGETILIQGGAGGVAGFAIQLAKHIGARVITTTSAANVDYVRGLGADIVVDYNAQDFTRVVRDCDAVFDTVGGDVAQKSFAVLKPGGRAAFIASGAQAPKPDRDDVTALRPAVGRARAPLERIAALVATGAVRPPEIKLYRLSEAAEAHRVSESRHFRGKLVFQVR